MIATGVYIDGVVHRVVILYAGQFRERHETLCGLAYDKRSHGESRRHQVDCAKCLAIEHPAPAGG